MDNVNEEVLELENGTSEIEEEVQNDLVVEDNKDEIAETPAKVKEETPQTEDFDFNNPQNLPPELSKYYKGMQAAFTRKQQAVSEALSKLQPHAERLTLLDRAAQGDPQARAYIASTLGLQMQQPSPEEPVDVDSFETPQDLVKYMQGQQEKAIQQALSQFQQQLVPQLQNLQMQQQQQMLLAEEKRQQTEYEAAKSKFPDFDNYLQPMIELRRQYPGMSMEEAYKLATYKKPIDANKATSTPKRAGTSTRQPIKKIESFEDAVAAAERELAGE